MLALISFAGGGLACLDFGQPVEPKQSTEERVRSILADLEARKAELLDIGFNEAVPILVRILQQAGEDPAAVLPPVRALGFLGRPQGAAAVGARIRHPDARVRLAAIRSLGQMGKFESIPLVEPFLSSSNRAERREAIIALGKFAKPELIPEMERAAGADPEFQKLAEQGKKRIAATQIGIQTGKFAAFVDALIDTDEYEDILPLMMVCWRPLRAVLADPSRGPETKERALRLLAMANVRRSGPEMKKLLGNPQAPPRLRLRAAYGLGRIRARSAVDQLAALLDSTEPGMRDMCILSLGRIGDPRALAPLLSKWELDGGARREQIRVAISRLCSSPGSAALLDPLRSYQPRAVENVYFITDSLQVISGYRRNLIDAELNSSVTEARRDALLLLATFGEKPDSATLQHFTETDADPLNREIANLGIERLKDIPLWERP